MGRRCLFHALLPDRHVRHEESVRRPMQFELQLCACRMLESSVGYRRLAAIFSDAAMMGVWTA